MTPLKAVRAKCLDCCCGQAAEVRLCEIRDCSLYEFRMGHNPNKQKRELTEEQRADIASRLKNGRLQKGKTNSNP